MFPDGLKCLSVCNLSKVFRTYFSYSTCGNTSKNVNQIFFKEQKFVLKILSVLTAIVPEEEVLAKFEKS